MRKEDLQNCCVGTPVIAWIDGPGNPAIEAVLVGNYADDIDADGKPLFRLTVKDINGTQYFCSIGLVEPDIHAADRNWSYAMDAGCSTGIYVRIDDPMGRWESKELEQLSREDLAELLTDIFRKGFEDEPRQILNYMDALCRTLREAQAVIHRVAVQSFSEDG